MTNPDRRTDAATPDTRAASGAAEAWTPPTVMDLPRLEDVTLQTGGAIPGFSIQRSGSGFRFF